MDNDPIEVKKLFLDTILQGGLLKGPPGPLPEGIEIVRDVEVAGALWSTDCSIPDAFVDHSWFQKKYIKRRNRMYEFALMSERMALSKEFRTKPKFQLDREHSYKVDDIFKGLGLSLATHIPKEAPLAFLRNKIQYAIPSMLYYIFYKGTINKLYESMLSCYFTGGMPCGWHGKYPEGNIICYWPHDEAPVFKDNIECPWHGYM